MAIQLLSQETIDKIAAGEVIERPASVIKELVENSIDARATAVTVEIRDGGTTFIRVTDNGCGISKDEIALAFLRHSTSKITSANDLVSITTLGFRGEALSSIGAVSQVELLTKTRDDFTGVRYCMEGGIEKSLEEVGTPDGTTFLVRNLFYNTPARKKFLKTNTTEGGYVQDLMEHLALSHPEVSFKLIMNNQMKLHTSGNTNLKDIIYQIYGRDVAANLIEVNYEGEGARIDGFIGKPIISRGNRQYETYFVNGRYVKNNIVTKAIEDGYKNYMMQHQYPFTVLHVQFRGEELDVNVHPTKKELRFSHGEQVYQLFYQVVCEALGRKELIPDVRLGEDKKKVSHKSENMTLRPPEVFEKNRISSIKKEQGHSDGIPYPQKDGSKLQEDGASSQTGGMEQERSSREDSDTSRPSAHQDRPLMPSRDQSEGSKLLERLSSIAGQIGTGDTTLGGSDIPVRNISDRALQADANRKIQEDSRLLGRSIQSSFERGSEKSENISSASMLKENTPYTVQKKAEQMSLFEEQIIERRIDQEVQIIGQVFATYWIVQFEDKMFIIDQHAAHEKVLYERMLAQLKNRQVTSQLLSPPIILTLSSKEIDLLETYRDEFEQLGFSVEAFGGKEYAVNAVPANLLGLQAKELFLEMLDSLEDELGHAKKDMILDKIASMSCKAAIKGNMNISRKEAEELLRELMTLDNPYHCPHGRPVIISMSKYELEKKFKRIV